MTYSRREVVDNETVVDKDHYDNLQDGIDEALKGNQDAKAYTDQQISLITETGIPKLVVEVQPIVAEIEGQTEFEIDLSTYDERTDTLMFYSGVTKLSPNKDYTLEGNKVILTRGLPLGRTGDIYIFKNVPMGEDGSVSGKVIAPNTLPADRLEGLLSVQNGGIFTNEDTTEEQKVDARNALKEIGISTIEYVDNQITLITETGIPKFMCYDIPTEATQEGQTVFPITLDTFDELTDTVRVFSGLLRLSPNRDYTVENNTVVLAEGIPLGRTLDIEVRKNVPMGEDGSVSGKVIADNTLSMSAVKDGELATAIQSLIDSGVIEVREKVYTPSNNVLETIVSSTTTTKDRYGKYVGKFTPKYSGVVKMVSTLKTGVKDYAAHLCAYSPSLYASTNSDAMIEFFSMLENLSVGSTISADNTSYGLTVTTTNENLTTYTHYLPVTKGIPFYFLIDNQHGAMVTTTCDSIKLYADEV